MYIVRLICHYELQAGPGTIAEALIRGLPIVLNDYIPGQVRDQLFLLITALLMRWLDQGVSCFAGVINLNPSFGDCRKRAMFHM